MKKIGVGNTVDGRVDRNREEDNRRDVFEASRYARDHGSAGRGLDQDDERHDGEDIMERGEGHEPVHHEVVGPDQENQCVDWKNPYHEHEHGVYVVGEVVVCRGALLAIKIRKENTHTHTEREREREARGEELTVSLACH